jgi:hypothetical protein
MGGKPSKTTPADKRLKQNKPGAKPMPKPKPKATNMTPEMPGIPILPPGQIKQGEKF